MTEPRIIKRYANRKLYDTQHSRYVTLDQISEMIRLGDEVKIIDNKTKEDLTSVTLAQIIFEEEKKQRSFLPLTAMRNIIQNGGEWFAEAQRRVTSILPFKDREDGDEEPEGEEEAAAVADDDLDVDEDATYGGLPRRKDELAALRQIRDWVQQSQKALDDWQHRVDGKIRHAVESISPFAGVQKDIKHLAERIAELESKLIQIGDGQEPEPKE
ncbi:MAG: polyhydroxyalkanoate synthesis regulator DNA-binding domain-containing protein [Kofleriaceae bacterium]|nr:polyhydroxyalkanoate synthesis regulator DNA-binding domain-containing protein [Myxococcales bacterium]MCB9559901.1 polyhydroxyalkanoate synthesis regulator DNA-binding domain-containing protein [Kofleriaceae bacterium]MCB9571515.1 polyhydroxyalkanoate synthesis regulator DNA-binding domain-containing protein [Kofleriaceae bacterium]